MNKTVIAIVGVVVILGLVLGVVFFRQKSSQVAVKSSETQASQEEPKTTLELAVDKRPYVVLIPRFDGKALTLNVENFDTAKSLDYELTYQTDGLTRGAMGNVKLEGKTTYSQELLLGACSKNVCTYDKNVETGSLTVKFNFSAGVFEDKLDFHLQKVPATGVTLSSQDGNIAAEIPTGLLNGQYVITMSSSGLVQELKGRELVVGPYAVLTSGGKLTKPVTLSINAPANSQDTSLYFYDAVKKDWVKVAGTLSAGKYTAQASSLGSFILARDKTNSQ